MKKYSGYLIGSVLGGLITLPFVGPEIATFGAFFSFILCLIVEIINDKCR